MGRPLKQKYFDGGTSANLGVGGEGFATVAVVTTGTLYSTTTNYTWTSSAPQIPGGTAASGTLTIASNRGVSSFNVVTAGAGFTSTSSVTVTVSPATTGSAATYSISLTANGSARPNTIGGATAVAYLNTGSSSSRYDIIKQTGSHTFFVQNSDGTGRCKLVAAAPGAGARGVGEMTIIATDGNGSTYYVTKLTSRKALLTQKTMSTAYVYNTGDYARWTLSSAVGTDKTVSTTKVSIGNN